MALLLLPSGPSNLLRTNTTTTESCIQPIMNAFWKYLIPKRGKPSHSGNVGTDLDALHQNSFHTNTDMYKKIWSKQTHYADGLGFTTEHTVFGNVLPRETRLYGASWDLKIEDTTKDLEQHYTPPA